MAYLSAPYFWFLTGYDLCWSCRTRTSVHCVGVPAGAQTNPTNSDFNTRWPSTLAYIKNVSAIADSLLAMLAPCYSYDASKTAKTTYRMNHCEHCGARLGDHHLHHSGAVFGPLYAEDISVSAYRIPCTLVCHAERHVGALAKSLGRRF